jgi:hypothetical protein
MFGSDYAHVHSFYTSLDADSIGKINSGQNLKCRSSVGGPDLDGIFCQSLPKFTWKITFGQICTSCVRYSMLG